ncbi:MAG: hypothetical protein L3J96_06910 [Thermoplasmata archaeon]|nr:hypothetical protein [Thermoplasmata archaeon]
MQRIEPRGESKTEFGTRKGTRVRGGLALVPALAAAVVLLLVLTPFGQAAAVFHPSTFVPPYNGKGLVQITTSTLGCGGKATVAKAPKFTTSTGVATGAGRAKDSSCSSPLGYTWAKTSLSSGYFSRPMSHLSGLHHVVVQWKVSWNSTVSANLGPGFKGAASASSFLVATLYLLDETNGTYLLPSSGWSFLSSTVNGTVHSSSSATFSMYLNQTLVSSHTYVITPAINWAEYAQASSTGHCSASAFLSISGPGGTKLLSVTLT